MIISEEEKKEILSKYNDNTSDELLSHLKRTFPVTSVDVEWSPDRPWKFINVDGKTYRLENNKKYLVGKISSIVEDSWVSLGVPTIRRTVKKYLDGINFT